MSNSSEMAAYLSTLASWQASTRQTMSTLPTGTKCTTDIGCIRRDHSDRGDDVASELRQPSQLLRRKQGMYTHLILLLSSASNLPLLIHRSSSSRFSDIRLLILVSHPNSLIILRTFKARKKLEVVIASARWAQGGGAPSVIV